MNQKQHSNFEHDFAKFMHEFKDSTVSLLIRQATFAAICSGQYIPEEQLSKHITAITLQTATFGATYGVSKSFLSKPNQSFVRKVVNEFISGFLAKFTSNIVMNETRSLYYLTAAPLMSGIITGFNYAALNPKDLVEYINESKQKLLDEAQAQLMKHKF